MDTSNYLMHLGRHVTLLHRSQTTIALMAGIVSLEWLATEWQNIRLDGTMVSIVVGPGHMVGLMETYQLHQMEKFSDEHVLPRMEEIAGEGRK